jgi:hypothetical protein
MGEPPLYPASAQVTEASAVMGEPPLYPASAQVTEASVRRCGGCHKWRIEGGLCNEISWLGDEHIG